MLSKTSQYALRAVLHLARDPDTRVPAADVAAALDVPENYLSKILHALSRSGVVRSERGPRGGYRLARSPERMSVADVIVPFDPIAIESRCLLGNPRCPGSHPCAAHDRWRRVSEPVTGFFRDTSVSELLQASGAGAEPTHVRRRSV